MPPLCRCISAGKIRRKKLLFTGSGFNEMHHIWKAGAAIWSMRPGFQKDESCRCRPSHDCRVAVTLIMPHIGIDRDTLAIIMVRPGAIGRRIRLRFMALITKVGRSELTTLVAW